jgi:hypothetical protein
MTTFLHIVSKHWLISFLILYVALTLKTVIRYHSEFLAPHCLKSGYILRWHSRIRDFAIGWPKSYRKLWRILVWIVAVGFEFAAAVLLWLFLRSWDAMQRTEEEKRAQEFKRAEIQRKFDEANWRAKKCKEYLTEHPPTLYYKTIDGLTAVQRPVDYDANVIATKRALRDGRWMNENVLMPISQTYLFAHQHGRDIFSKNWATDPESKPNKWFEYLCGWPSDLDDIVAQWKVNLVEKSDIFVPWVNESVRPFGSHVLTPKPESLYAALIEMQVPREFREIQAA